jgi:hypothetical protein
MDSDSKTSTKKVNEWHRAILDDSIVQEICSVTLQPLARIIAAYYCDLRIKKYSNSAFEYICEQDLDGHQQYYEILVMGDYLLVRGDGYARGVRSGKHHTLYEYLKSKIIGKVVFFGCFQYAFIGAVLRHDMSRWDLSNIIGMKCMFAYADFKHKLPPLNFSACCIGVGGMFFNSNFKKPIDSAPFINLRFKYEDMWEDCFNIFI